MASLISASLISLAFVMNVLALVIPASITLGLRTSVPTPVALTVTSALTWAGAASMYELWRPHTSDAMLFFFILPQVILFIATIVAVVTTHRPRVRKAILAAALGYAIGFAVRAVVPPCCVAFQVACPAIYAASAAVLACAR